mgnify:CR=1 FL=1
MGEYADAILDGDMCQICGMYVINGDGSPQTCPDCLGADDNKKTYVTFGSDHKHKVNGKFIDNRCIAVIKCNDAEHGRKLAFELFSTQFCVEYHEDDFDSKIGRASCRERV